MFINYEPTVHRGLIFYYRSNLKRPVKEERFQKILRSKETEKHKEKLHSNKNCILIVYTVLREMSRTRTPLFEKGRKAYSLS